MRTILEMMRGGLVMSPPDEGQQGGDGNGNGGGAAPGSEGGGDNGGGAGEGGAENQGGDKSGRTAKMGGLFGQRSQGQQPGNAGDEGGESNPGDPPTDGRPAGLAEKFWDADKKEIRVDALIKAQSDTEKAFRDLQRSKGNGEVPKNAGEYFASGVAVPEEAANFKQLTADDPGVKAFADVCLKRGIGKDMAAGIISDMLVAMNDHASPPIDPEQEMKALGKGGPAMVEGLFVWVEGMEKSGDLSGDDIDVIESMMMTANGARLLAKFRNMTGEQPIPVDPGGGVGGMSLDALDAKYREAVKKGDYAEQERLDKLRNVINPDGLQPGISGRAGGYSLG